MMLAVANQSAIATVGTERWNGMRRRMRTVLKKEMKMRAIMSRTRIMSQTPGSPRAAQEGVTAIMWNEERGRWRKEVTVPLEREDDHQRGNDRDRLMRGVVSYLSTGTIMMYEPCCVKQRTQR
jgi:hypothetical protein